MSFFPDRNAHKVKAHPSLQKGGCHEAHDIEDLVKVGQVVRGYAHTCSSFIVWYLKKIYQYTAFYFSGCSYFAALSMADDADLVFCPYSYIINPVVRKAMDVDINGAIIILDEAQYVLLFRGLPGAISYIATSLWRKCIE